MEYSWFFSVIIIVDGALAEKLGIGLQNRADGSVTRTCLHLQFTRGWWNLVDTRDLKFRGRKVVRVQFPLRAPTKISPFGAYFSYEYLI